MAQLHPEELTYIFVAFYDSQGYVGGVGTRLHEGLTAHNNTQLGRLNRAHV
jgi:hypothetical protein